MASFGHLVHFSTSSQMCMCGILGILDIRHLWQQATFLYCFFDRREKGRGERGGEILRPEVNTTVGSRVIIIALFDKRA